MNHADTIALILFSLLISITALAALTENVQRVNKQREQNTRQHPPRIRR